MNEYTDINDIQEKPNYNIAEGLDKIELYERFNKEDRTRLGKQISESAYSRLVQTILERDDAIRVEREKLRESGYKSTRFTRLVRLWRKGLAG